MLHSLKTLAESEHKRLTLCRLTPEFRDLIETHSQTFSFDIYGETAATRGSSGRGGRSASSNPALRFAKRIGVPVLIILPLALAAEYFLVLRTTSTASPVIKSFEGFGDNKFVVYGTVEAVRDGRRVPDQDANVMVWSAAEMSDLNSEQNTKSGWVSRTDAFGEYNVILPLDQETDRVAVRVVIVSGELSAKQSTADPQAPSEPRERFPDVARQTNVFTHWLEAGEPLRIDTLFF
jgi:hypothetical protein